MSVFGLMPWDVDRLTLRDIVILLKAAKQRRLEPMQRMAILATCIYNFGGMRGKDFQMKDPGDLFPALFGKKGARSVAREEMEEMKRRHLARLEREKNGKNGRIATR